MLRLLLPIAPLLFMACLDAQRPPENHAAVCLQGELFITDGMFPLRAAKPQDAHGVSHLRWQAHEGCERFVIDVMAKDGSPAVSAGTVRAGVLRDFGVVRLTLYDVEWVDPRATEATFNGQIARAAYSVWADEGRWVYIDLHLANPADVHVAVLEEPGRVLVDLRPGGGVIPPPAAANNRVVVLEPRPGQGTYPLTVTGYARTFEANVVARIEHEGEVIHETFTTATAWVDAWGHYTVTIEDGPLGQVQLHVGEYSPRDGSWEGVAVELDMR